MLVGNQIFRFEQVGSTNDVAWQHSGVEKNNGLLVVADEQTSGRGRRGDAWLSPPGSALYMSLLLHPDAAYRRPVMLTIWAGLGVCSTIEKLLHIKPQLKWPNDVLLEGKKVCGILVEQRQEWFVVGVGLNVSVPVKQFQSAGIHHAASLQDYTQQILSRSELLAKLQTEWDQLYRALVTGNGDALLNLWKHYCGLIGQSIKIESNGKDWSGTLRSLSWDEIMLEHAGKLFGFQPESVTKLGRMSNSPELSPGSMLRGSHKSHA